MPNTPLLVFDIETVPDVATGKRLYPDIRALPDDDALTALIALRHAEAGNDFMRLPLHKVACLSFLWFDQGSFNLKSLTLNEHSEDEILRIFLRAFAKKPTLISWNGAGFDLPVLLYRMTHHRLNAAALTNAGFKQNDYLNRYSEKHIDVMDRFTFGAWGNKQKLDTIASLCGFAGKGDVDGSQVVPMVQRGEWDKLANYCESDVLNTWLIYLRWLSVNGKITHDDESALIAHTYDFIGRLTDDDGNLRHQRFLDAWEL
ncbi:3'-5' exonuclease [Moraxella caviae]|uniref:3'-5' exonuclease n=1 Tax=Moraxella caviae TaxID=34060 RepID=A0A1S9ZVA8_9GAMM|nr:3'-5' exonuclease [Moraxella caviae]